MRIELATLESGRAEFAHSYVEGEFVLEEDRLRLAQPPEVSGEVRRADRRAHVKGRVVAGVQVDYLAQQADELTEDDLDLTVFDGEVVDIDALVTEEILLTVPDHILCKDDCKGICPGCGADRNSVDCGCETAEVDPRWAGLKELVNGK